MEFRHGGGDNSVQDRQRETGTRMEGSECLLNDDYETLIQQREKNCSEDNDIAAKHERGRKFSRECFDAFAEVKERDFTI